ncbi:MAG: Uxx-star family glutaredoxin-like (seleno)protein [Dehalococcoidia bacterium]|nr:Uxx-star family glutaredoxin-like (seleno)protein [Dehalococcoidia bacterium]
MNITIYTTPTCGYCHQAKRFLSERGVKYAERDISRDRSAADEMVRLTGQMGVPVIVVDGQAIIGFDRPRLESLIAAAASQQRPRFGLKIADAGKMAQKSGAVPVFGALVGAVAPGSLGAKAGIQTGDIITELNLRHITTADDLEKALSGLVPGNRATIVFLRGQQSMRAEIAV